MTQFKAFWVEKSDNGVTQSITERSTDDLPAGELLVQVKYSSLNYKDAMSAKGLPGVTRNYPHTPGIDAAGIVTESANSGFAEGDEVIVIGFDLGMNTAGGFGQYIRVPAGWAVKLPACLNLKESMILGTAGFTAALCIDKLHKMDAAPADGPVLVTGATGGVGSVAVALLAKLGYEVVASTGTMEKESYLTALGAKSVIERSQLEEASNRPLLPGTFSHAVDTVGGDILANVIKSLNYGGSVSVCGLVASPNYSATVLPFLLRGVNMLGIDSVELPIDRKESMWNILASDWRLENLSEMCTEIGLGDLSASVDSIIAGETVGRLLISLETD
jgi:alcohol dehydrogenase|tara:strand:- start:5025 stop:6020 length:996 start_codon:yes stop_codon:yes gene_type:complete